MATLTKRQLRNQLGNLAPSRSDYPYLRAVPQISDAMHERLTLGIEPTADEEARENQRIAAAMAAIRAHDLARLRALGGPPIEDDDAEDEL